MISALLPENLFAWNESQSADSGYKEREIHVTLFDTFGSAVDVKNKNTHHGHKVIYLVFRIDFYSEQNDFQCGQNGLGQTGFWETSLI